MADEQDSGGPRKPADRARRTSGGGRSAVPIVVGVVAVVAAGVGLYLTFGSGPERPPEVVPEIPPVSASAAEEKRPATPAKAEEPARVTPVAEKAAPAPKPAAAQRRDLQMLPGIAAPRVPPEHWEANLVRNPGFEVDADGDGRPDGWNLPPAACTWDADIPHAGERSLRFTNRDKNRYMLITAPVTLIPGVRYHISAWVRGEAVRDGDESSQGAGLCIEWMDAGGKWLGGSYPSCKTGTFGWTQLEGGAGPVPAEAAKGHIVLYLRKHNVGTAWFDDVEVRAIRGPKLAMRLLEPAYRATVEVPTEGKAIALEISVNRREYELPSGALRLQAAVTHDGTDAGRPLAVFPAQPAPEGEDALTMSARLPRLPVGSHTLAVRLLDRNGNELAEARTALRVVSPLKRKVTLDERGRLIVDGKPFFPLGLYLGPTEDEHLARIAAGGFNTILCYGYGAARDPRAYLDRAKRHGLKVVYSIKDFYEDSKWYPKREGMSDLDLVRDYVTRLRDHPAIIAWYTNDELGPAWMPKLRSAYDLVRELDPDHPALQVLCSPSQFRLYYGVTDILGCDPYPIPRNPVTMVGDWMDTATGAMSGAKPVWCVPQVFQWGVYKHKAAEREPTFEEKRAMIFLALIHRARGLICYSYFDLFKAVEKGKKAPPEVFERRWREVASIIKEVQKLTPVLLEGCEVGFDHESAVRFRALEYGGAVHVMAVNTATTARRVAIPVPRGEKAERVDRGGDAPVRVEVRGGRLLDRLDPLETAIYVVR